MRAGATFTLGEVKIRPGFYERSVSSGEGALPAIRQGRVGAVIRGTWGPLAAASVLATLQEVDDYYGTGGTSDLAREAMRGGAREVVAVRAGSVAASATRNLADTQGVPVNVVTITAKYPGTRGNGFTLTLRDALSNSAQRELLVMEGTTLLQQIRFEKGGANEADDLVAAVADSDSPWITATRTGAGGDGATLAAVNGVAMAGGTDPAVDATAYGAALTVLEAEDWNVLAVDTEDPTFHATVQAYVDRINSEGMRVMAVVGEPTSVAFATRKTDARAFNDPYMVYVGNGGYDAAGQAREGYLSAARVAGIIAGSDYTASLTNVVVPGWTSIVGPLTNSQIEDAILSGMVVLSYNAAGQVRIEYGITTLVTPGNNQDASLKKIRQVREHQEIEQRIALAVEPLIGRVNNDATGRAAVVSVMQGVLNQAASEGALIQGARAEEDPANPPVGDQAWFRVLAASTDAAEKIYTTFNWGLTAAAA